MTEQERAWLLTMLTTQEKLVLHYVAEGWTNQEVATELGVKEQTIRGHMGHILTKLALRNRTEAALLHHGILCQPSPNR